MKKLVSLLFVALFTVAFVVSSCSDSDDKNPSKPFAYDGVYKGKLDINVKDMNVLVKGIVQKIKITTNKDQKIKLELNNFSFGDQYLGDIVVDDMSRTLGSDSCAFKGVDTLKLSLGSCKVDVDGIIKKDSTHIDINVTLQDGLFAGLKVIVKFKGKRLVQDQSSEAKIVKFTFSDAIVIDQPVIDENKNITFKVPSNVDDVALKSLVPTISVSPKATITPNSGVAQDFTAPVVYTVISEDSIVKAVYTVKAVKK